MLACGVMPTVSADVVCVLASGVVCCKGGETDRVAWASWKYKSIMYSRLKQLVHTWCDSALKLCELATGVVLCQVWFDRADPEVCSPPWIILCNTN